MSATQELIAAALTAADELDRVYENAPVEQNSNDLREACARAMVQPAAPDMAEVWQLLNLYDTAWLFGSSDDLEDSRTALLDYVRGILAERDALIADNERLSGLYEQAVKGRADMRSALREARAAAPQPVGEFCTDYHCPGDCGLNGHGYQHAPQPVSAAEVPMPEHVEQLAITRYRPVPNGMFGYKVVAGDGTRSVFEGTKSECTLIARKRAEMWGEMRDWLATHRV
jgi:hypothetical protein